MRTGETTAWMVLATAALMAAGVSAEAAAQTARKGKTVPSSTVAKAMPATGNTVLAPQIALAEGKSTLIKLPYPASRMSVGDSNIADVILLNPSELYILGKNVGSTNLILWNKQNDATIVDVVVSLDTTGLSARLAELMASEKDVRITAAANTLIVSGMVSDVVKADQILSIANAYVQRNAGKAGGETGAAAAGGGAAGGAMAAAGGQQNAAPKVINMLTIAAPQQVMLEVRVAEVSKTLVDQLGVGVSGLTNRGSWTYGIVSNLLSGNPSVLSAGRNGNVLQLDAQKRDGMVKVLAEPTIMAISGQEASFLAGGKIFIPVSQSNNNGGTRIELEEKEFGIAVKFTPTVLDGGRINLKVAPEVSDLNKDGVGITASGVSGTAILPSFTTRRASTTVQLYDGQSFAIGGLIKNNVTTNVKAFPLLGEIPVLGALFRSSDFQTDRSELVFIITPHLVKPLPANYKLPTDDYIQPTRSEFFLGGKHEGTPPVQSASASAAAPAGKAASGFELK